MATNNFDNHSSGRPLYGRGLSNGDGDNVQDFRSGSGSSADVDGRDLVRAMANSLTTPTTHADLWNQQNPAMLSQSQYYSTPNRQSRMAQSWSQPPPLTRYGPADSGDGVYAGQLPGDILSSATDFEGQRMQAASDTLVHQTAKKTTDSSSSTAAQPVSSSQTGASSAPQTNDVLMSMMNALNETVKLVSKPKEADSKPFNIHVPKNISYDGSGDWYQFEQSCENFVKFHNMNDVQKAYYLSCLLKGKALEFYQRLQVKNKGKPTLTYHQVISLLRERFKDTTPLQAAIINFNAAKQNDGESATDFLERLQLLADKAYPDMSMAALDATLACHFGKGLLDPGARQHVLECECKSVNDVYQRYTLYMNAKALSGFQSASTYNNGMNGHFHGSATVGHPPAQTAVQQLTSPRDFSELVKTLEDRVSSIVLRSEERIMKKLDSLERRVEFVEKEVRSIKTSSSKSSASPGRFSRADSPHPRSGTDNRRSDQYQRGSSRSPSRFQQRSRSPSNRGCFRCNEIGHQIKDCPYFSKDVRFRSDASEGNG